MTEVVWINVSGKKTGKKYFVSRCKPMRRDLSDSSGSFWEARSEKDYDHHIMVHILRLRGLKHDHAYLVDLIKALQGKPFILQTMAPPKGSK